MKANVYHASMVVIYLQMFYLCKMKLLCKTLAVAVK